MKLYIYRGLDGEKVPKDVTHVIVDDSVTIIKNMTFYECKHLVSIIMGDNVKRIEHNAFFLCIALRFVRLSKTLEYIGFRAFSYCTSLEVLFLPSTVTSIGNGAFYGCFSLRLLILPNGINLNDDSILIFVNADIYLIAEAAGVAYEENDGSYTFESVRRVNEWLVHHMDDSPFHILCYNSSVTTKQISDYLIENGNESALRIDAIHGMTALHMLSMNPHAPVDTISALLDRNTQAVFCLDNQDNTPLDCARNYNVGGLVGMVAGLCNHRNSSILAETDTQNLQGATKRRRKFEIGI